MKKIVFLSILVIIGILFASQIKRGFLSLLIFSDTVRSPKQSVMSRLFNAPLAQNVKIQGEGRVIQADLYVPRGRGRHFPLLLVRGFYFSGEDDEKLALMARNFARAGFLVLVPDFEGMKYLRLRITDAEDVLKSYLYLKNHDRAGAGGAMMGISYSAGPMLLAAADPRIRDKVGIIATFGGYYDLRNVLLFSLTGAFEYGGHRGYLRPDESRRWMLAYKNLDVLNSRADREKLRMIIEKRNRYEYSGAASLVDALSPQGRAVYDFFMNDDQEQFTPLYENLPLSLRTRVYQLSSARAVKYIKASFIIVHAMDDYAVPYTESLRLQDAVDPKRVRLALLPQFLHNQPAESSAVNIFERYAVGGWRLFSVIYELLEQGGV